MQYFKLQLAFEIAKLVFRKFLIYFCALGICFNMIFLVFLQQEQVSYDSRVNLAAFLQRNFWAIGGLNIASRNQYIKKKTSDRIWISCCNMFLERLIREYAFVKTPMRYRVTIGLRPVLVSIYRKIIVYDALCSVGNTVISWLRNALSIVNAAERIQLVKYN